MSLENNKNLLAKEGEGLQEVNLKVKWILNKSPCHILKGHTIKVLQWLSFADRNIQ